MCRPRGRVFQVEGMASAKPCGGSKLLVFEEQKATVAGQSEQRAVCGFGSQASAPPLLGEFPPSH